MEVVGHGEPVDEGEWCWNGCEWDCGDWGRPGGLLADCGLQRSSKAMLSLVFVFCSLGIIWSPIYSTKWVTVFYCTEYCGYFLVTWYLFCFFIVKFTLFTCGAVALDLLSRRWLKLNWDKVLGDTREFVVGQMSPVISWHASENSKNGICCISISRATEPEWEETVQVWNGSGTMNGWETCADVVRRPRPLIFGWVLKWCKCWGVVGIYWMVKKDEY